MDLTEQIDKEGIRVQDLDFPILNLFKMINAASLFIILIFMGFSHLSLWVRLLLAFSMMLGFVSLFIPSVKPNLKQFSRLSVGMYVGALVAYVAAQS